MSFTLDRGILRTILRINAGWLIWAGALAVTHLLAAIVCASVAVSLDMGSIRALTVAVGLVAGVGAAVMLYRIVSNAQAHRGANVPRSDRAVDYLAGTVVVVSLLGIGWTTMLAVTSNTCPP